MGGDAASRVLIIEDELTSRTILLRWLESAGYVADVAVSGEEAVAILQRQLPDVICLDLGLPGYRNL